MKVKLTQKYYYIGWPDCQAIQGIDPNGEHWSYDREEEGIFAVADWVDSLPEMQTVNTCFGRFEVVGTRAHSLEDDGLDCVLPREMTADEIKDYFRLIKENDEM